MVLFSLLLLLTHPAAAGGLQPLDQSARALSIGGSTGALVGDPTATHSNPALLSWNEGPVFSLGALVNVPDLRFYGVSPSTAETKMQAQVLFPPSISLTYGTAGGFGAGVNVTFPYQVQTEWDPNWIGSRLVVKSDIRVALITPVLSMKFTDEVSIGAGLELGLPKILYEQRFPVTFPGDSTNQPDADVTYDGSGNVSYGALIGVYYHVGEALSLGASYRSHMNLGIDDGRVRYRGVPSQIASQYAEGRFSTTLVLPDEFLLGGTLQPLRWITFYAGIDYSLWSEFTSTRITFSDPTKPDGVLIQNWRNVLNSSFGLEAGFADFSVRAGLRSEKSPIPDQSLSPGLPDAGGTTYSIGFGYRAGEGLVLDFAYALRQSGDRAVSNSALALGPYTGGFNGRYSSQTASVAINVTYSWK